MRCRREIGCKRVERNSVVREMNSGRRMESRRGEMMAPYYDKPTPADGGRLSDVTAVDGGSVFADTRPVNIHQTMFSSTNP